MGLTAEEWSYTAGIIDGEGCIKIRRAIVTGRHFPQYQLVVQVDMVSKIIITWLQSHFGGKVYAHRRKPNKNWNDSWRWYLLKVESLKWFLEGVLPYILLKIPHIQNALEYLCICHKDQRTYGREEKEGIWKRSCELNRRGRSCQNLTA